MDKKAIYALSYGVFMLSTKSGETVNGCITNTCMQVAGSPTRIAIAAINQNYTCELIKKSGIFDLSILDESYSMDTIKHFGFQSGRNVDKFAGRNNPVDADGIPYLGKEACSLIKAKVVNSIDLGTHTLFIGEVTDAVVLSDKKPLTYAKYQEDKKASAQKKEERKIIAWKCKICGYEYQGAELPKDFECPICEHPASDFEPVYEEAPAPKKIVGWRCKICKYEFRGEVLPADFECPICEHPASDFEPIYED